MPNNLFVKFLIFWLLLATILFLLFFYLIMGGIYGEAGNKYVLLSMIIGLPLAFLSGIFHSYNKIKSKNKETSTKKIWACVFGKHEFGDPEYLVEGSCERKEVCKNCKKENVSMNHNWTAWKYINTSSFLGLEKEQKSLMEMISNRVSLQEVKDFCFNVEVDYDNLAGETEIDRIGSLIDVFSKKRAIQSFVSEWSDQRPDLRIAFEEIWKSFRLHEPKYADDKRSLCEETRFCLRCKKEESREEHKLGEEVQDKMQKCLYKRTCIRCEIFSETIDRHQWQVPEYRHENDCDKFKSCIHCDEEEYAGAYHHYQPQTEELEDKSTRSIDVCTRCGDIK